MSLLPSAWGPAWLCLGAAAATGSFSPGARADEPSANEPSAVALSEQRAAEAFQAYSKKDYSGAVALYLKAYEAAPNGSILYNIARIYDTKLADRPLAITYYRRYIADPGAYTERIEFANQRLTQLRDAEALSEKLDDSAAAKQPERPEPRTANERPSRTTETQSAQRAEGGWSSVRWAGVALGAVGVAALGTGAGFGLAAMSKARTANELCDGNDCTSQRGVDAANSADRAATISNIGFAAGGGLLLTGLTLFLIGGEESAQQERGATLRVETAADPRGAAVRVSGRW
ncbi:MAG TPA: hypothetical protein VG937_23440 [Polyangiaceae bacterium]|nr:hypothetical protein [Polyangiaceae bacterium]